MQTNIYSNNKMNMIDILTVCVSFHNIDSPPCVAAIVIVSYINNDIFMLYNHPTHLFQYYSNYQVAIYIALMI